MKFGFVMGLAAMCVPAIAGSAGPGPETLKAWNQYVQAMDPQGKSGPFLWIDRDPLRAARVRKGEILADSIVGSTDAEAVPFGLIHHWVGAAFIPGVTPAQVFAVVDDYDRYSQFYSPTVIDSAVLCRSSGEVSYRIRYFQKVLFMAEVLDSEYQVKHVQVDGKRWYSVAQSTRLKEVRDQSKAGESSRYVWRIYSVWRYEQRDGGVYLEQENVVLSRSIPNSLRWLVEPAIRELSKDLTLTSLRQTREAVNSTVSAVASR